MYTGLRLEKIRIIEPLVILFHTILLQNPKEFFYTMIKRKIHRGL
jgi:hypothetical protein